LSLIGIWKLDIGGLVAGKRHLRYFIAIRHLPFATRTNGIFCGLKVTELHLKILANIIQAVLISVNSLPSVFCHNLSKSVQSVGPSPLPLIPAFLHFEIPAFNDLLNFRRSPLP